MMPLRGFPAIGAKLNVMASISNSSPVNAMSVEFSRRGLDSRPLPQFFNLTTVYDTNYGYNMSELLVKTTYYTAASDTNVLTDNNDFKVYVSGADARGHNFTRIVPRAVTTGSTGLSAPPPV